MKPTETPGGRPHYHFFLDGDKKDVDSPSVNGATVRAFLPAEKTGYGIFLEGEGNAEDRQINDVESFSLEQRPPRFYSVPPATFGRQ